MKKWFKFKNQTEEKANLDIFDQIGLDWWGDGITAKTFNRELSRVTAKEIDLHIDSPGGEIHDGFAIYNALKEHPAKINVIVDGLAASIASVIAMVGDTITMHKNSMLMIHEPWGGVSGNSTEMRKYADLLDKLKAQIIDVYTSRTGMDKEETTSLMDAESWLTADESVDFGFADTIIENKVKPRAFAMLAKCDNLPECFKRAKHSKNSGREEWPDRTVAIVENKKTEVKLMDKKKFLDLLEGEFKGLKAEIVTGAARAERERITGVLDIGLAGHKDLVQKLAFDGVTSPENAAVAILKAEKDLRAKMKGEETVSPVATVPVSDDDLKNETPADDKTLPLEERIKAKWDKDAEARDEFNSDFDAFSAYETALAENLVKVLSK